MLMKRRKMFGDILAIINLFKTVIYHVLYYSFKVGQYLVIGFSYLSTVLLNILEDLLDIFSILLESSKFFYQDILQCVQQIALFLGQIWESILTGINGAVWNTNTFLRIANNGISEGCNHVHNSLIHFVVMIFNLCKLCKYTIILFGSGVWFAVTLIPYSVWNLLILIAYVIWSTPLAIFNITGHVAEYIKDCIKEVYLFVTDVPVESVIGIIIGICLIYLLTQFYVIMFSYLYSKTRTIFLYVCTHLLRKLQRLTLRQPRNVDFELGQRNEGFINNLRTYVRRPALRPQLGARTARVKLVNTDDRFCVICQEHIKCILLLPCRHVCLCTECNTRLQTYSNTCPICRNDVESTMKIFV